MAAHRQHHPNFGTGVYEVPPPESKPVRLTAEEKAFARYIAKGLTVEAAAVRIGKSKRQGFRLLARLREAHQATTDHQ